MTPHAPAPIWEPVALPRQATATEAVADLPGARLWYWDTGGEGPPVVFLHAGTQSGAGWGYQQPVFAAHGYRAIGYSRRSYHGSDCGSDDNAGYGSTDLHDLLGYLGLDRVHLVAVAHGGFFALDFALSYPERARSLALVSSLLGVAEPDYKAVNDRLRPPYFANLPHDFKELCPSYRAGDPDGVAAWNRLAHDAVPGRRVMQRVRNRIDWAALESLAVPVLLMTGDADLYVPPALARMQHAHLPGAEFHVIPGAGHAANWEQPALFNQLILEFIVRH